MLHGLATPHGFVDGNKRTAWLTTEALISNSGYELVLAPADRLDDIVVDTVTGKLTQDDLANWYKARITEKGPG